MACAKACEFSGASLAPAHRFVLIEGGRTAGGTTEDVRPARGLASLAYIFVVAALVAVLAVVASQATSEAIAERRSQAIAEVPSTSYIVRSGDSVWGIAQQNPVEGLSTTEVVLYIQSKNELSSASLKPGQVLSVPTDGA